jgi:hypothetical protein
MAKMKSAVGWPAPDASPPTSERFFNQGLRAYSSPNKTCENNNKKHRFPRFFACHQYFFTNGFMPARCPDPNARLNNRFGRGACAIRGDPLRIARTAGYLSPTWNRRLAKR